MNLALKQYSTVDSQNFEDIEQSIIVVKDQVNLLEAIFHKFDYSKYFVGSPLA
jgi:type I restriction enzyme R subunit